MSTRLPVRSRSVTASLLERDIVMIKSEGEIDEKVLESDDYVHWERKVTRKPDGSTAYP